MVQSPEQKQRKAEREPCPESGLKTKTETDAQRSSYSDPPAAFCWHLTAQEIPPGLVIGLSGIRRENMPQPIKPSQKQLTHDDLAHTWNLYEWPPCRCSELQHRDVQDRLRLRQKITYLEAVPEDAAHVAQHVHTRPAPQRLQRQQLKAGNAACALSYRHRAHHMQHHGHTLALHMDAETSQSISQKPVLVSTYRLTLMAGT